jgi:hypothetical protein
MDRESLRKQRSCFGVRWRGPPLSYRGRRIACPNHPHAWPEDDAPESPIASTRGSIMLSRHGRQRWLAKPRARPSSLAGFVAKGDIFDVVRRTAAAARDSGHLARSLAPLPHFCTAPEPRKSGSPCLRPTAPPVAAGKLRVARRNSKLVVQREISAVVPTHLVNRCHPRCHPEPATRGEGSSAVER